METPDEDRLPREGGGGWVAFKGQKDTCFPRGYGRCERNYWILCPTNYMMVHNPLTQTKGEPLGDGFRWK